MKLNNLWLIDNQKLQSIIEMNKEITSNNKGILLEQGRYKNDTNVILRDGVAIIKIEGIISKDLDWLNYAFFGGSASLNDLAKDFYKCLKDESVTSIIFDIDSPGGTMSGVNEFAEIIYNSRGVKPIVAYTNGIAASAAYYIASACDEIVIDETGGVGSIGVIKTFYSNKKETISFVSSQSYNKNISPESNDGKEIYQSQVDDLAEVFIQHVAKYRNLSKEDIIKGGNYGAVIYGQKAIDSKLCDRFGSLESLILDNKKIFNGGFMNKEEQLVEEKSSQEKEINAAYEKGVMEERERVSALQQIKIPGTEAIIQNAIVNGLGLDEVNAEIVAYIQNNNFAAEKNITTKEQVIEAVKPVVAEEQKTSTKEDNLQKIIGLVNRGK